MTKVHIRQLCLSFELEDLYEEEFILYEDLELPLEKTCFGILGLLENSVEEYLCAE